MQMFYLGRHDKPLFEAKFETWKYGPVEPDVYNSCAICAAKPIPKNHFSAKGVERKSDEWKFIDEMLKPLLKKNATFLVNWTHESIGAWAQCYIEKEVNPISNDEIKAEYNRRKKKVK